MTLEGKVAVVTGGAQGIGRATCERFVRDGARVVIADLAEDAGHELADRLGGAAVFVRTDVADAESAGGAVQAAVDAFGGLDVLVNNAGITRDATLGKMTGDQFDAVVSVNLKGVYLCTQAALPHLDARGGGAVLNAASVVAHTGNFGQTNYVATKAGVIGMTKTWARELGRKGIRVNAVAPGFVATEMVKTVPEKVLGPLRDKTPLGRLGEPEDVAAAYAFLASDDARFITGAVLNVDGGLVL
ncbi:3-oxoacyl-ACP reductase FabG [Rubrivirga litoralis]|uniref:3-oxoacyl-ACP reductase FabG n=1 Tax=Rubrivirga litoralis TaxID=3075598 RepID=A0ABU3BLH7_9BACT|nr:3-oxoacyl-ACP reductase FabG [Rubrivirga sp. F394]MDT0630130.1 3-oxoacyl-ACP reductase FabG [Rubrivirga sp. F394]